jgi:hypothetical protein
MEPLNYRLPKSPTPEASVGFRVFAGVIGVFALANLPICALILLTGPRDSWLLPSSVGIIALLMVYPCWRLAITGRLSPQADVTDESKAPYDSNR